MERYVWGVDGIRFSEAEPVRLNYGERMRIVLVNDTMMEHPIHLHGLWSDLEDESGDFHLRKHTISVPPGTVRSYRVSADASSEERRVGKECVSTGRSRWSPCHHNNMRSLRTT